MKFTKNIDKFNLNKDTVKYIHLRWDLSRSIEGGATICYYLDFETKYIYFNYSICAAGDNFNRRIGREISLGRLKNNYVQVKLEKDIRYKNCCEAIEKHFFTYTVNDYEYISFHDRFSKLIIGLFLTRKEVHTNSDGFYNGFHVEAL
jgi:hypothetical protein|tara:strand:- start:797 stop:1237 length:441 start_codon:yes stop_codon:yes gene_type:complete